MLNSSLTNSKESSSKSKLFIPRLMLSRYVYTSCEKLQDAIYKGAIDKDDQYINVVMKMQEFLRRLVLFSHRICKDMFNIKPIPSVPDYSLNSGRRILFVTRWRTLT